MNKKIISVLCALVMVLTSVSQCFSAFAENVKTISNVNELKTALASNDGTAYALAENKTIRVNKDNVISVTGNASLDGRGSTIECMTNDNQAMIAQNDYVTSKFSNVKFAGISKKEVGIWIGAGVMELSGCSVSGFSIKDGRNSAVAVGSNGVLNLNDTVFSNNTLYDIGLYDSGVLNLNGGSSDNTLNVLVGSNFAKINVADNWQGTLNITFTSPNIRTLGTVSGNADNKINVTNDGCSVQNENGKLVVKSDKERAIRFDLSSREKLYKGSAGFLYGQAEINVPSVDLLYGLKPDTMVQKALGGLQHPTSDAVRTRSSLLASGVRDMQIYFQDMYLEWPYDAPVKNGSIDVDSYQKEVEKILYGMICKKASADTNGSFLGSDGNYYVLDKELARQYSYVLFNEPDQIWYGGKLTELEKAWKQIYTAVRKIDPDARCAGPNYSGYSTSDYEHFIKFCYENDCLPQLISWHELGDISMTDFYEHYDYTMSLVDKYYKNSSYQPQLLVNEYARHYDIGSVGGLVKWLAMFEDKDMSGCLAYWAMANSLNELAADQNSPASSWWVYHWYAQMTGEQCTLTSPAFKDTRFYGLASYDSDINMAYALFGGSEDENGTEVVYLDNLSSTELANSNGAVGVKIYAVSFSGQQGANYIPECIFDGAVNSADNSLRLQVNETDEMDAYFAVITRPDENAVVQDMNDTKISTLSYEAEESTLLGGASAYSKIGWTAFATSGRADVGNINNNGDGVQFNVTVPEDGRYTVSLFYSLQSPFVNPQTLEPDSNGQNRGIGKTLPFGMSVDGNVLPDIYLESTVSWAYKNHCDVELNLSAGSHTITYTHINGNEANKGNLQLVAAIDKLDLTKINTTNQYDFEIDLAEMSNFKTDEGYRVTAVAPAEGYYRIISDNPAVFSKQSIDYAADAKTYSEISVYDIPVGDVVYLSKGANTISVAGSPAKLSFVYDKEKTEQGSTVITADDFTLHGTNPVYKSNKYAVSGKVVSNIGIGQSPVSNDSGDKNYILFKVNASADGVYNLAVRYSNNEPAPVMLKADGSTYIHPYNIDLVERYAQICVNDDKPQTVYFRNTLSWDTFKTLDVQVKLNAGVNTIKIYNDNSYQFSQLVNSTAPEIDTITVTSLSYGSTAPEKIAKSSSSAHTYGSGTVTKNATCSAEGNISYTCSDCGYIKNESVAKLPHSYFATVVNPSCTSQGYTTYRCSACGDTYTADTKQAAGYNYGDNSKNCFNCGAVNPDYTEPTAPINNTTTTKAPTVKKPKATSISKLKAGKKQFKATWKKVSGVTGYQIQYSTSKKFTKKTTKTVTVKGAKKTSATVKKLKSKKKYYVRIRTYKGKTYSSWSKVKTVKTK